MKPDKLVITIPLTNGVDQAISLLQNLIRYKYITPGTKIQLKEQDKTLITSTAHLLSDTTPTE